MEQDKILTHVYVVKVESKQQDKDNSNDVCDIHLGVLRIFANKEDAMAYMREYYDKCQLTSKSIEIFENTSLYCCLFTNPKKNGALFTRNLETNSLFVILIF